MTDLDAGGSALAVADCGVSDMIGLRRWLREHVSNPEHCTDAELAVTELVANAIDHADGASAVRITIAAPGPIHIEVDDTNTSARLTVGHSRLGDLRGNGLTIVDSLATWGVRRGAAGKTVWADL